MSPLGLSNGRLAAFRPGFSVERSNSRRTAFDAYLPIGGHTTVTNSDDEDSRLCPCRHTPLTFFPSTEAGHVGSGGRMRS